uniref:Uncharacterized protein n=1 Tax=Populus trichocarpa TaxID=3694 RepID=U5GR47_POPTR
MKSAKRITKAGDTEIRSFMGKENHVHNFILPWYFVCFKILYLILKINSNMVLVLWEVSLLGQTINVMKQGGKEDELITYL